MSKVKTPYKNLESTDKITWAQLVSLVEGRGTVTSHHLKMDIYKLKEVTNAELVDIHMWMLEDDVPLKAYEKVFEYLLK